MTTRRQRQSVRITEAEKRSVAQEMKTHAVKVHSTSKVQKRTHRGSADKPSPTNYVAVPHHEPSRGYVGKYVPTTPKAAAAAKELLAKMNVPRNPAGYIGG